MKNKNSFLALRKRLQSTASIYELIEHFNINLTLTEEHNLKHYFPVRDPFSTLKSFLLWNKKEYIKIKNVKIKNGFYYNN